MTPRIAPALTVAAWLNTAEPASLDALRGRVVLLVAFQMLCPGCVRNALPQAMRAAKTFSRQDLAVIGLHTVFEHHDQMQPAHLEKFLRDQQFDFPVGIDQPAGTGTAIPTTMAAYGMQGTPTLVLIDRSGRLRKQKFGHEADLTLGAEIMALALEKP